MTAGYRRGCVSAVLSLQLTQTKIPATFDGGNVTLHPIWLTLRQSKHYRKKKPLDESGG